MAVPIARRDENPVVVNGYGEKEWLCGTHKLVHGYKCLLSAGTEVEPKRYTDKTVVYIFSEGTGYITTSKKAYNIEGISFFVPDFDNDWYKIRAVTDMEYMMVIVDMIDSDIKGFNRTHVVLPSFKRLEDGEPYTQDCKGPNTKSWGIIIKGHLARVLMGVVLAEGENEGTFEKGHPSVDQWNYTLPGADFTMQVEGEEPVHHTQDEWSYVKAGLDHQLSGKKAFYVWFEHMTAELNG